MMFNPGNKIPRRKPGSRPRSYREMWHQTQTRPVATAGLTKLSPILSDGQLESQKAGKSSEAKVPRVTSASGERPRQRVKSGKEMCLKHKGKDINSLIPPPPNTTRDKIQKTKTEGERERGQRLAPPTPPPKPNRLRNRHQSKAQSESGLETLERQLLASSQNQNYQSLPFIALPPGLTPPPPLLASFGSHSQLQDPESDAEWHEPYSSVNFETVWEPKETYMQAASEPMLNFSANVSSTEISNVQKSSPSPRVHQVHEVSGTLGFDLRDCYQASAEMNDDGLDTDDEERFFGNVQYDKVIREDNILEVADTIVFSPYKLWPNRDKWQRFNVSADHKEQAQAAGCFKAIIRIRNTSKFNMTYQIKSSSLKMFRISEQIGLVLPESTKEIAVLTNPRMTYTFEEIADSAFVIQAHPILFRRQLLPVMIDAFWRAIDSEVLSLGILEIHPIKWVRPESDDLLGAYNMLDRVRLLCQFRGNPAKIQSLCLPPIDARTFNKIWHTNDLHDRLLQLKFQNSRLHRKATHQKLQIEEGRLGVQKLAVAFALTTFAYIFVAFISYLDHYEKTAANPPSPPPDTPWYEKAYGFVIGLFSAFGNGIAATGAAVKGWFV